MTEELKDKIMQYIAASLATIGVLLISSISIIFAFNEGIMFGLFFIGVVLMAISYVIIKFYFNL